MFSAMFGEPVANSIQVAGMGSSTDGVFFGHDIAGVFGILHSNRGVRETRTLTVTTASSTTETIVVRLNGIAYNVAVTNSGNIQRTVYEISQGTYGGWSTEALGATVIFVRGDAGPAIGTYSVAGTTVVGTFAQDALGVLATNTWIPQASWNGVKLDGTGPSRVVLNPALFNVYQISMQYLGAGAIRFFVEAQSEFVLVHTLRFPNTRTQTTFGTPSFPFTAATYSAGSSENVALSIGSFAGFIEGKRAFTGDRFAANNVLLATVNNAAYYVLFTLQNPVFYEGKASQGILNVMSVGGAASSTGSITLYVFRTNRGDVHDLQGNPDFQPYAPNSAMLIDTSATTLTITDQSHLIWSGDVAFLSSADTIFGSSVFEEMTLQPGEYLSVCARTASGTAAYVSASIDIRQDY